MAAVELVFFSCLQTCWSSWRTTVTNILTCFERARI